MNKTVMILIMLSVVLLVCTAPSITDGPGGSEITNGKVAAIDGSPVSGLTVSAFPENYISGFSSAGTIISSVTSPDGVFELAIDSGFYNIYVVDTSAGSGCLIRHVGSNANLGTLRLDLLGTIEGMIHIDSASAVPIVVIFCRGSPLRVNIASRDGLFRFDRVPSGEYALSIAEQPPTGCAPGIDCSIAIGGPGEVGSVTVKSGMMTTIDTLISSADIGRLH